MQTFNPCLVDSEVNDFLLKILFPAFLPPTPTSQHNLICPSIFRFCYFSPGSVSLWNLCTVLVRTHFVIGNLQGLEVDILLSPVWPSHIFATAPCWQPPYYIFPYFLFSIPTTQQQNFICPDFQLYLLFSSFIPHLSPQWGSKTTYIILLNFILTTTI